MHFLISLPISQIRSFFASRLSFVLVRRPEFFRLFDSFLALPMLRFLPVLLRILARCCFHLLLPLVLRTRLLLFSLQLLLLLLLGSLLPPPASSFSSAAFFVFFLALPL